MVLLTELKIFEKENDMLRAFQLSAQAGTESQYLW